MGTFSLDTSLFTSLPLLLLLSLFFLLSKRGSPLLLLLSPAGGGCGGLLIASVLGFLVMMTLREVVVDVVVVVLIRSLLPLASWDAWMRVDLRLATPPEQLTDVAVNPETPGLLNDDICNRRDVFPQHSYAGGTFSHEILYHTSGKTRSLLRA